MIIVVGAGLVGLSAAARLARVGHRVLVVDQAGSLPGYPAAGDPGVITLPALWRDLFTKSGRPLAGAIGAKDLELASASPRRLSDGLLLPDDRAGQWHLLDRAYGRPTAEAWRDLLDRGDQAWQELRHHGVEAEAPQRLTRDQRRRLLADRSLTDLAADLPAPLAELVLTPATLSGNDPGRMPGWFLSRLSIERLFGRWRLRTSEGRAADPGQLLAVLAQRCLDRGARLELSTRVTRVSPGLVMTEREELPAVAVVLGVDPWQAAALTRRPAPRFGRAAVGPRWDSARTRSRLPGLEVCGPAILGGSAFSPAGPEAWAQLATGSLIAYRCHRHLTGQDIRPVNREFSPPPLPRPAP